MSEFDEFDLRRALREGEGDTVDADQAITHALAYRRARRVRIGSMAAAAAVVVGVVGIGGAVVLDDGSTGRSTVAEDADNQASRAYSTEAGSLMTASGGQAAGSADAAIPAPPNAASAGPAGGASAGEAKAICPETAPNAPAPPAGPATTGPLFDRTVDIMTVCGYSAGSARTSFITFTGEAAQDLARSVNNAPTAPVPGPCDQKLSGVRLVLIGTLPSGQSTDPVVAAVSCGSMVSDGTAVRYGWTPPADLDRFIDTLSE